MEQNQLKPLLERYLGNQTTPEENEWVEQWLLDHDPASKTWTGIDKADESKLIGEIYQKITAREGALTLPKKRLHRIITWRLAGAAAILVLALTLYWQWRSVPHSTSQPNALIVYKARTPAAIRLSDNSTVILGEGAEIQYPSAFTTTREVYLKGNAYFDVEHNSRMPFIVHSGSISTRVLGTAFDISSDEKQHRIMVTVARGKVSVNSKNEVLEVLTPNERIEINTTDHTHLKKIVDAARTTAWTREKLLFDDQTFASAAKLLEQRYQVRIQFANNNLEDCRFTGTIDRDEKLDSILNVLCTFNHSTYRRSADGIYFIEGKGCN